MLSNRRQLLFIIAAAVLVVAGAIYYFASQQNSVTLTGGPAVASTELMVAGPLGEMGVGDPKAPKTVIEYASMTCPHCQRFHADVYPAFKKKYVDTGKVYFIFREYPLDPLATAAIVVARCGGSSERYFAIVDLLFDRQADWAFVQQPVPALRELVKQAGITSDQFQACLTNQTILDGVNWVKNRGEKQFGVNSTPTFFFDGVKYSGAQSLEAFDKILGG